jgi:hypothetical protein
MIWDDDVDDEISVQRSEVVGLVDFVDLYLDVEERVKYLRSMSYEDYLQTEFWRITRKQILGKRPFCERCGTRERLQVHHLTYERLGVELDEDLEVLCRRCHATEHGKPYDEPPKRPFRSYWSGPHEDDYPEPDYSADYV